MKFNFAWNTAPSGDGKKHYFIKSPTPQLTGLKIGNRNAPTNRVTGGNPMNMSRLHRWFGSIIRANFEKLMSIIVQFRAF
mgnify:CR=1 FL=1